jgi:hypothetical protein
MGKTGSESCPKASFGISGVELSSFATTLSLNRKAVESQFCGPHSVRCPLTSALIFSVISASGAHALDGW